MIRSAHRFALMPCLAAAALAIGLLPAAAANSPTLLGAFKNWSAYTIETGGTKVCYALSQPKSTSPKNVKRDPVFFLISDWPARKAKGEPEVVPGYPYKKGSKVTAQVGSDKFTFFTQNDGSDGCGLGRDAAGRGPADRCHAPRRVDDRDRHLHARHADQRHLFALGRVRGARQDPRRLRAVSQVRHSRA